MDIFHVLWLSKWTHSQLLNPSTPKDIYMSCLPYGKAQSDMGSINQVHLDDFCGLKEREGRNHHTKSTASDTQHSEEAVGDILVALPLSSITHESCNVYVHWQQQWGLNGNSQGGSSG